jgi:hypothetical protein
VRQALSAISGHHKIPRAAQSAQVTAIENRRSPAMKFLQGLAVTLLVGLAWGRSALAAMPDVNGIWKPLSADDRLMTIKLLKGSGLEDALEAEASFSPEAQNDSGFAVPKQLRGFAVPNQGAPPTQLTTNRSIRNFLETWGKEK